MAVPPKKTNKRQFGGLKRSKHFKGNKKGAGKSLSYPIEIDQEILIWLLELIDPHLPILSLALRKFAISKSLSTKNLKQAEAGFKKLVNLMDLHYEDAPQLLRSYLNS